LTNRKEVCGEINLDRSGITIGNESAIDHEWGVPG
jgi:hypothetical protein